MTKRPIEISLEVEGRGELVNIVGIFSVEEGGFSSIRLVKGAEHLVDYPNTLNALYDRLSNLAESNSLGKKYVIKYSPCED